MTDEIPDTGFDVPSDADESDVPDHEFMADRADEADPAFDDDADASLEEPVDGESESDEPDLGEEPSDLLTADEQVDPEEHDDPTIRPEATP